MKSQIFLPCIALVGLTAAVWVRLYVERIGEMRARRIAPQSIATSREASQTLKRMNAADNFRNLFEVPVLFYVLCIALFVTAKVTPLFIAAAWLYAALRGIHSLIHVSYNRVSHRFAAYVLSTLLLFTMWIAFGVQLLLAR